MTKTQYHQHGFNFSETQLKKVSDAVKNGTRVDIKLGHDQLEGPHKLFITTGQLNRINKLKTKGVGMMLKLSIAQLKHEKMHGGFLMALLPALGTALATGAASSVGSWLVDKIRGKGAIIEEPLDEGKGLYLPGTTKSGGCSCMKIHDGGSQFPIPYPVGALADVPKIKKKMPTDEGGGLWLPGTTPKRR